MKPATVRMGKLWLVAVIAAACGATHREQAKAEPPEPEPLPERWGAQESATIPAPPPYPGLDVEQVGCSSPLLDAEPPGAQLAQRLMAETWCGRYADADRWYGMSVNFERDGYLSWQLTNEAPRTASDGTTTTVPDFPSCWGVKDSTLVTAHLGEDWTDQSFTWIGGVIAPLLFWQHHLYVPCRYLVGHLDPSAD